MRLDEDDVATLHQQLAWLSKREGFVQRRLAQAGIVDELLRGSLEDSFERLRHRFISAIHTLPGEQTDLLLDVFALSPDTQDVPEMHGGIIYEETSTLIVIANRRWQATYEQYRFANMAGELDYVTIGRSYPGVVTPSSKDYFKINTRPVDGAGWNDHF